MNSDSLFSCFNDIGICLYGGFCSPCQNASTLAKLRNEHCTVCHCVFPVSPFWVRQMVKENRGIEKDFCSDSIITVCCYSCAVCQNARMLKN